MNGYSIDLLGRSFSDRILPAKQSSVYRSSTSPVLIRAIGSTPPKVQAYCFSVGTIRLTSMVSIISRFPPYHSAIELVAPRGNFCGFHSLGDASGSRMMASTGHSWEGEPVRLLSAPLNPTLLSPRVNPAQVRRLLRLGIILRWVAIACAGLAGVLSSKPPPLLFYLMLAALIYNLAVMVAAGQATEAGARRLAPGTTVMDQFFDLGFIAIYAGALPNGHQVAPYVPGLIEAVAYFGVAGAILSVAIFFAFAGILDAAAVYVGHGAVSPSVLFGATLIVALIAVTLVPVIRILTAPIET